MRCDSSSCLTQCVWWKLPCVYITTLELAVHPSQVIVDPCTMAHSSFSFGTEPCTLVFVFGSLSAPEQLDIRCHREEGCVVWF